MTIYDAGLPDAAPFCSEYERATTKHAEHFACLCERLEPYLESDPQSKGRAQVSALSQIHVELDNLLVALDMAAHYNHLEWIERCGHVLQTYLYISGQFRLLAETGIRLQQEGKRREGERLQIMGLIAEAQASYRQGLIQQALDISYLTVELAIDIGDPSCQIRALLTVGMAEKAIGHRSEARKAFEQALYLARKLSSVRLLSLSLNNLGVLEFDEGNSGPAVVLLEEAATLQDRGDLISYARTCANLGMFHLQLKHYDKADQLLGRSQELANTLRDHYSEIVAIANLATIAALRGDLALAASGYTKALSLSQAIGARSQEAYLIGNLGLNVWEQGDKTLAQALISQEAAIHAETGSAVGQARSLCALTALNIDQEDWISAINCLRQTVTICMRAELLREAAISLFLTGILLQSRGRHEGGPLIRQALKLESDQTLNFDSHIRTLLPPDLEFLGSEPSQEKELDAHGIALIVSQAVDSIQQSL